MNRAARLAIVVLTCMTARPQPTLRRMPEDVAVFAVCLNGQSTSVNPIVVVHYGTDQRFKTVPSLNPPIQSRDDQSRDDGSTDYAAFERVFYKPGSSMSLFAGGERVGSATVRSSKLTGGDGSCVDLSASITHESSSTPFLSTNTNQEIAGHSSKRRAANVSEVEILRRLSIRWLSEYGLSKPVLLTGTMGPVVSTVLRGGGNRALIGRFDVKSERAIHRLFVVAEQDRDRYRPTLTALDVQQDLEYGKDEADLRYIDQLDIDNDGIDELICSVTLYENSVYEIWRFDPNLRTWYRAYSGGCADCSRKIEP
jgi:hypothetical protein